MSRKTYLRPAVADYNRYVKEHGSDAGYVSRRVVLPMALLIGVPTLIFLIWVQVFAGGIQPEPVWHPYIWPVGSATP